MSNATNHVGFVANSNCGRGTISLLLQCLSTIFLCVYTSQHLNVPIRRYSTWRKLVLKCIWVATCVIAPELMTSFALYDWTEARHLVKWAKHELGISISKKQAHYICAGGMRISSVDGSRQSDLRRYMECPGRFSLDKAGEPKCREFWGFIITNLPSDYELDELSNSSAFSKIITCLQTGKTLILIIGRAVNQFDVSLIEIATGAYIIMALVSYIFWWNKPCDIRIYQTVTPPFEIPEVNDEGEKYDSVPASISEKEAFVVDCDRWTGEELIYFDRNAKRHYIVGIYGLPVLASIFGVLHFAAWNYAFPTGTESSLWKGSSIMVVLIPWLYTGYIVLDIFDSSRQTRIMDLILIWVLLLPYISARLFLLVEMFIGLRSAPRGIYQQPDWTTYLGHDGA